MTAIHLLTDKHVQEAGNGDHADGGGLSLRIYGNNAKWLYRAIVPGKETSPSNVQQATPASTNAIGTNHKGSRLLSINCQ